MKCLFTLSFAVVLAAQVPAAVAACENTAPFAPDGGAIWNGWGGDRTNARHSLSLTPEQTDSLELAWAFGFSDVRAVIGQPSVVGDRVFIGVDTGEVVALDVLSGCDHWSFTADAEVRTAPVVADVGGWTVFFGDLNAQVYAVDADTGSLKWKVAVDPHPTARITGTPQFLRTDEDAGERSARLFVPVSSGEEGAAGGPDYNCCTFRGSVVALDASDGAVIWKTHTVRAEPSETAPGQFGPSGGAVWSPPTVDPERGLLWVGTGDAYSAPAEEGTDAIVAIDLFDGHIQWIAQATANDIWTAPCMRPNGPEDCGPDHDFGSPPMLVSIAGSDLLVAGQKSGIVWAHDPDTGALVWQTPLVEDTTAFGGKIIWGGAADEGHAYFGLGPGGIGAVRLADGAVRWFTELAPFAGRERHVGQDGPLTVGDGVLFSGGWDGILRALSTETGAVIWEYDTIREFDTVNGVPATGGSMGAAGPVAAEGRLFVPSGYVGVKNGMAGNVLLAFAPHSEQGRDDD